MFKQIRWPVILIPSLIFIPLFILGNRNGEWFIGTISKLFESLMIRFGWMLSLGVLAFVVFMIVLIFHPIGKIKLGGESAKPRLKTWQWFAVSLCAGIGTGIVFWGAVEPLLFTMQPAPGLNIEPQSNEAIIWSMRTTFLHWSLTPYAIYVTFAVILAYVYYNMNKELNVSSGFVLLLGNRAEKGVFATFIDTLTVFALVGGVAGSLGYGLKQIGMGMNIVFGIPNSTLLQIGIAIFIILAYTISSVSGLEKGILWLSQNNVYLYIGLLVFLIVAGPTAFIFNLLTQSTGAFVNNFVEAITFTSPFPNGETWPQWWDMYWWADWLSFAPIMGLFFVRLGYGQTIRKFVIVNWLMPSLFSIVWFSVFGGTVIHAQIFEGIDLFKVYTDNGAEALTLAAFDLFPVLAGVLKPIMIVTILLSFVTCADSMTSSISTMSLKNNSNINEAPISIKLYWGVLIGSVSLLFTILGGIDGIKYIKTFAGFPILFIGLFMLVGFVKHMSKLKKDKYGKYLPFEQEESVIVEKNP